MSAQTPPPLPPLVGRIYALRAALEQVVVAMTGITPSAGRVAMTYQVASDALEADAQSAVAPEEYNPDCVAALRRFVQRVDAGLLSEYLAEEMRLARAAVRRAEHRATIRDRVPLKIREVPADEEPTT